jgi:hypothetical protein
MLLVHRPTIRFVISAWVVAADNAGLAANPLEGHHRPPSKAGVIFPGLVHIQLFNERAEEHIRLVPPC